MRQLTGDRRGARVPIPRRIGLRVATLAGLCLLGLAPVAMADNTYTWSGQQPTGSPPLGDWAQSSNWSGTGPGDGATGSFVFPSLAGCSQGTDACGTSDNTRTGVTATGITVDDGSFYDLTGNQITLGASGIAASTTSTGGGQATIELPIALGADQTWSVDSTSNSYDSLDVSGRVTGSTMLGVNLSDGAGLELGGDDEVGAFTASGTDPTQTGYDASNNGNLDLDTSLNATNRAPVIVKDLFVQEGLSNPGSVVQVGPLTAAGDDLTIGEGGSPAGGLSVNDDASIDSTSVTTFNIADDTGDTAGTDYSQLSATGNVSLGGDLDLEYGGNGCTTLTPGTVDTLVQADGTLSGTFDDAADGAVVQMGAFCNSQYTSLPVRVNYDDAAGTVTATLLGSSTTALSASPTTATTNQSVTLRATVSQGSGTPAGTVEFENGFAGIPGCTAQPVTTTGSTATATCTTSFDVYDGASLSATFTPSASDSSFAGSDSTDDGQNNPLSLTINPDASSTAVHASSTSPAAGASVTYTATVSPADNGPALPSGAVQFMDGTTPISCRGTDDGYLNYASPDQATCTTSYPAAAAHSITAQYQGDGDFSPSTSAALTVTVPSTATPTPTPTPTPAPTPAPKPVPGKATLGAVNVSGTSVKTALRCAAHGPSCKVRLEITRVEMIHRGTGTHRKTIRKTVVLGSKTVTVGPGKSTKVKLSLTRAGRRLLAKDHRLTTKLKVTSSRAGKTRHVSTKTITFKVKPTHRSKPTH